MIEYQIRAVIPAKAGALLRKDADHLSRLLHPAWDQYSFRSGGGALHPLIHTARLNADGHAAKARAAPAWLPVLRRLDFDAIQPGRNNGIRCNRQPAVRRFASDDLPPAGLNHGLSPARQ